MKMETKYKAARNLLLYSVVLFMLGLSSVFPQAAYALPSDLFVSTAGSGLICTQADPCDLATAMLNAQDGDHIYFAAGTYTSASPAVLTLTNDISLYGGWDGSTTVPIVLNPHLYATILDGENDRRVVDISAGAAPILDGFTLANGYGDYSGGGVRSQSSHPTIQNCIIQNNRADGDGGGIFLNRGSAQILDNRILDNSANWAGGLRIINSPQVTVRGNYIIGNTANNSTGGIDIDCCGGSTVKVEENWIIGNSANTYGGGVALVSTNAVLVNNIIVDNSASEGAGVYVDGAETYPVDVEMINNTLSGLLSSDDAVWIGEYVTAALTNNILSSFAGGILVNDPGSSTITADHNLFWNTSDPVLGTNAIQADPLLDAQHHLTGVSPALNAGTVVPLSIDIDGDPRPNGAYDIGADEYFPKIYLPLVSGPD
jgi:hypothetical protein